MNTLSLTIDVRTLAREADYIPTSQFAQEDVQAGLLEKGNVAEAVHYPLLRLTSEKLISDAEREQLEQIAAAMAVGKDVAALAEVIQQGQDASPLAVALARIARQAPTGWPGDEGSVLVLISAITGSYFGWNSTLQDGDTARALVAVLGAVTGAVAASAIKVILGFEGQQSIKT
jgi:hypothetical protein